MMPRRPPLIVALLLLVAPGVARAQPLFDHAESVEVLVDNADALYLGTLSEVVGARDVHATLTVLETIKGEHRDRLRVCFPGNLPPPPADLKSGRRVLVATQHGPPGTPTTAARCVEVSGERGEVLSADFTLHRGPVEVPRAARGTHRESSYGTGGHLVLAVPVDERLERWALDALDAPGTGDRRSAIMALRHFKSDANIARARALL